LVKFIQRCYYIRTHNALDIYRKYGPAFLPKGYVKVEEGNLAFFHLVPLRHLKRAQDAYLDHHYKSVDPKVLKHSYANPPVYEIRLHLRQATPGKLKRERALKEAQSIVASNKLTVDSSITHPKERVDALRKLLREKKLGSNISKNDPRVGVFSKPKNPKVSAPIKIPEPVVVEPVMRAPRLTKKQQKQNRAKHHRGLEASGDIKPPSTKNHASSATAIAASLNGSNGEATNSDDVSVADYRNMVEELRRRPDQQIYQLQSHLKMTLVTIITILESSNEFVSRDAGNDDIGPLYRWSYSPKDHITNRMWCHCPETS